MTPPDERMLEHMTKTLWDHYGEFVEVIDEHHQMLEWWNIANNSKNHGNSYRFHLPVKHDVLMRIDSPPEKVAVIAVDRMRVTYKDHEGFALKFADESSTRAWIKWRNDCDLLPFFKKEMMTFGRYGGDKGKL